MSESQKPFTVLEVGKPFELFYGRNMTGQTGCIFEQLNDGQFCLVVYMDNMSLEEVIALRTAKIQVRVIKETDDFVLTLIKYGNSPLVFEIAFDPTLYTDERRKMFEKSNMLSIISVDSNSNSIKTLRYVSMPLKLYDLYRGAWSLALHREEFSERYTRWIDDLDRRYSVLELWSRGEKYGEMGQEEWVRP